MGQGPSMGLDHHAVPTHRMPHLHALDCNVLSRLDALRLEHLAEGALALLCQEAVLVHGSRQRRHRPGQKCDSNEVAIRYWGLRGLGQGCELAAGRRDGGWCVRTQGRRTS